MKVDTNRLDEIRSAYSGRMAILVAPTVRDLCDDLEEARGELDRMGDELSSLREARENVASEWRAMKEERDRIKAICGAERERARLEKDRADAAEDHAKKLADELGRVRSYSHVEIVPESASGCKAELYAMVAAKVDSRGRLEHAPHVHCGVCGREWPRVPGSDECRCECGAIGRRYLDGSLGWTRSRG